MKSTPFSQEAQGTILPSLFRLESTGVALNLALVLFAAAKKLGHSRLLEWFGVNLLRCARRSLERAAPDAYIEFRADFPVQF